MSNPLERLRNMRNEVKQNETKLVQSSGRGKFVSITDLDEGKSNIRLLQHPMDNLDPFFAFRSTWLKVEEGLENLSRYHLENTIVETGILRNLGFRKLEELKNVDDDKLRSMVANELGAGYKKQVNKRVFISKMHGNTDVPDIIEEYILFAGQMIKGISQDRDEQSRKFAPIRGYRDKSGKWNPGIMPSTSWICYFYSLEDTDMEIRRLEIWDKHLLEIEKIYQMYDSPQNPLVIDLFSDPDNGLPLVIDKQKNEKGKFEFIFSEKKFMPNVHGDWDSFIKPFVVPKKVREELANQQPLNEIYKNVYGKRDFELALSGLQIFDETNSLGVFQHDDFLDIAEKIAMYYENLSPEPEQPKKQEPVKVETKQGASPFMQKPVEQQQPVRQPVRQPEPEANDLTTGTSPYGNNLDELREFIKEKGFGIRILKKHTFADVVEIIEDALREDAENKEVDKSPLYQTDTDNDPEIESDPDEGSFGAEPEAQNPVIKGPADLSALRARLLKSNLKK